MQANVFFGGNADPILSGGNYATPSDYDAKIAELRAIQQRLEQQRQQVVTANRSMSGDGSPTWDEIEKLTADLSDREYELISENEDFKASQNAIMAILQREHMKMMRPIVEGTADGKQAIEAHLKLIKSLRKEAAHEIDKNMELFSEYAENYADMTYSDFLKMKKAKKK